MENIFKLHPNLKEFFRTADGEVFYKETDANNHAKTLVSKKVDHIKKEEVSIEKVEAGSEEILYPEGLLNDDGKDNTSRDNLQVVQTENEVVPPVEEVKTATTEDTTKEEVKAPAKTVVKKATPKTK